MGKSRCKFIQSLKHDNLMDMEISIKDAGIFHKTKRIYHSFNKEYVSSVLEYCLNQTKDLDIFTNKKVGKKYQDDEMLVKNWKGGSYPSMFEQEEYLVFKCPCKFNNNKVVCNYPINAEMFLITFLDSGKDEETFDKLNKIILKQKMLIYETVYKRVVYCSNPKCKKSEGILLNENLDDLIKNNKNMINCTVCSNSWCLKCNKTFDHYSKDCEKLSEIKKNMDELLKEKDYEQIKFYLQTSIPCTNCNHWISKSKYCDHMTCSRCKHQFCWICLTNLDKIHISQHISSSNREGEYMCINTQNFTTRKEVIKNNRIKLFDEILGSEYKQFYEDLKFYDNYV